MSRPRQIRRLQRSSAAVETRYLRDLGRRERGAARAASTPLRQPASSRAAPGSAASISPRSSGESSG
jgi:hypothetical protein